jgi:CBS domain containing-hemolysin-like protein
MAGTEIVDVGIVVLTTITAGCMSGLTLSLFSLDENYLQSVSAGPNRTLAKRAERILELVQNPHWLLITMLVMNAAAVETMPLILDELINPVAAVAISVSLVLVFGEIIPQALFVKHALMIGSLFYYPLRLLMILTSPVSFTVGKLLDHLVGHREAIFFRRQEMRAFIRLHAELKQDAASPLLTNVSDHTADSSSLTQLGNMEEHEENEKMTAKEINIMLGALLLTENTVSSVLKTKMDDIVCLSADTVLTKDVVQRLFNCGFSRIPVYQGTARHSMSEYLITKTLIPLIYRFEGDAPKVSDLTLRKPAFCSLVTPLSDVYHEIQSSGNHMFFVTKDADDIKSSEVVGLITSHDVFEVMHQTTFHDEMDLRASAPVQMMMRTWQNMNTRRAIAQRGNVRSSVVASMPTRGKDRARVATQSTTALRSHRNDREEQQEVRSAARLAPASAGPTRNYGALL